MKLKLSIFYFLVAASVLRSQSYTLIGKNDFIAAYGKVCNWLMVTESYSCQLNYMSFTNHLDINAHDTEKGYYKKSGKNFSCEIMGIKTVQNNRVKLLVDSSDKIITITNPQIINAAGMDVGEVEKLLDNAKKISKRISGKSTIYRIDFKQNTMYEAYEIKIGAYDIIEQLTYYYSERIDRDYSEKIEGVEIKVKPKLEIHFKNFVPGVKISDYEFSENTYVSTGEKLIHSSRLYKNYTVRDYRLNTQK